MSIHSQRSSTFSDADAAVLLRALRSQQSTRPTANANAKAAGRIQQIHRQPDAAEKPLPSIPPTHRKTAASREIAAAPTHSRRKPGSAVRAAEPDPVQVGSKESVAAPTHSRRKTGSAVRAGERLQVVEGGRRVRRSRSCDDGPEDRAHRKARSTGSHSRRDRSVPANPLAAIAAWFTDLTPRTRHALVAVACVLAVGAFFYGPTADLYAAARDHDQLVAKVEATNAIADDLKDEVARLQTEEGVMDEARIRGYANPGEVAVDASGFLGVEDTVEVPELSKPIELEEPPLYIRALDVILGYEEHV